jgi:ankyrin repeat protein
VKHYTSDARGWTYLHYAADRYSVDAARVLLEQGAEVNAQDAYGNTPLARAVYRSKHGTQLELIRLFMTRGADPDIKNKIGESALDLICGNRVLEDLLHT